MLALEGHIGPDGENVENISLNVFTTQADEYSRVMLRDDELLESPVRRINLDPRCSDLPTDSLPQRLVTVQNQHLA